MLEMHLNRLIILFITSKPLNIYFSSYHAEVAYINPLGQLAGAIIMFGVLGFLPAFIVSKILMGMGMLRVPPAVELVGLDLSEEIAEEMDAIAISEADIAEAKRIGLIT